jgi:hypothetical protein
MHVLPPGQPGGTGRFCPIFNTALLARRRHREIFFEFSYSFKPDSVDLIDGIIAFEAAKLAGALEGKRTSDGQWEAKCPYHDDHTASLSIGTGSDGSTLVHCHAGCEYVFDGFLEDGHLVGRAGNDTAPEPARYEYRGALDNHAFNVLKVSRQEVQGGAN